MMEKDVEKPTVCVVDASTYVGFWILKKLLIRGYRVHAAVQKNGKICISFSHAYLEVSKYVRAGLPVLVLGSEARVSSCLKKVKAPRPETGSLKTNPVVDTSTHTGSLCLQLARLNRM
ncbi:cinnamoyl-CoA reductase-like SNL6 [Forsythia ovata]|uniref:Cinnamoyl-CoA reductase-like SNL6 n=1 Tax=Forsythia ovata TaxID=205694 RepID=A0ABD1SRJ3_9LAMI